MKKRRKFKKSLILLIIFLLLVIGVLSIYFATKDRKTEKPVVVDENKVEEEPIPEEIPDRRMSIVMVGDALIHGAVFLDASIGKGNYDFSNMFTDIEPLIKDYDLKYYNQESIIGGKKLGISHYPLFNSPDEIGEDLAAIGFNMVSLANNHTLDKGEKGVLYSISFWESMENVITSGTYNSEETRNQVRIYEQNEISYAFLSYTEQTNGINAPSGKGYLVNVYNTDTVKKDVEASREAGAEVIIVAMHWGDEYIHTPNAKQKEMAQYLASLGVNLVIGSHPHVIQPVDYIEDTLVIYSLGNFISAQRVLGLEKVIGLLAGVEIVVDKDGKVTFENLNYELLYTYYSTSNKDFKVIPFSNLTDKTLKNHESIEKQYLKILEKEVSY